MQHSSSRKRNTSKQNPLFLINFSTYFALFEFDDGGDISIPNTRGPAKLDKICLTMFGTMV